MRDQENNKSVRIDLRIDTPLFKLLEHASEYSHLSFSDILRRGLATQSSLLLKDQKGFYKKLADRQVLADESYILDRIIKFDQKKGFLFNRMKRNLISMFKASVPFEDLVEFIQFVHEKAIVLNCSLAQKAPIEELLQLATTNPKEFLSTLQNFLGEHDKEHNLENAQNFLKNIRLPKMK